MVDNTHSDPSKQKVPSYASAGNCNSGCGTGSDTAVVTILEEILEKLCTLEIPDLTILQECLATLKELIAELPDYNTALTAILTCLEELKLSNAQILECLQAIKLSNTEIVACLEVLKLSNAEILECLQAMKLSNAEIIECLQALKLSNAEILECLQAMKLSNVEIVECLQALKLSNAEIVECLQAIKLTQAEIIQCLKDLKLETNDEVIACLQVLKDKATASPTIWGVQEDCSWWDNQVDGENFSGLLLSQDTHEVTLTMNTGRTCKFTIPGTIAHDYDTQFVNINAALAQCTGKVFEVASAPRDGDLNTPLARHAKTTCCPGDEYIVSSNSITIGGPRDGRQLTQLTGYDKGELKKYKQYDCGPETDAIWTDMDGVIVEAPDLTCAAVDCAFPVASCCGYGDDPCSVKTYGPLQDCDLTTEPPTTLVTDIYVDVETCNGVDNAPFTYTLEDGLQVVYSVQGTLADSEKNPFVLPEEEQPITLEDFKVIKDEGGQTVSYQNTDEQTEMTVSVGSTGDIKIGSGQGDTSDAEITAFITDCLANGKDVSLTATGVGGESASATLLAAASTNPFPGFYNQSTDAAPAISFKVATMTATCEGEEVCALRTKECNSDELLACVKEIKEEPAATIDECCTGGATETTAKCANIPASWTTMTLGTFDRCTASFGGIDLPDDNYTYADFEALILGVGGTIAPNPANPDQYTICVPDGFSTCYQRGCFRGPIGQLTRACVIASPNTTEEECKNFDRVWTKYEEPIGNVLETSLAVQEDILAKACEIADNTALTAAKNCLMEEHLNPAAPCPVAVPPEGLNKELQTLTLDGNHVANYGPGQSVNLQNANGESCGTGTVSDTVATVYSEETGKTVITLQECELEEGKTAAVITQATPVKAATLTAIKTIKTLTAVKTIVKEPVKEPVKETVTR